MHAAIRERPPSAVAFGARQGLAINRLLLLLHPVLLLLRRVLVLPAPVLGLLMRVTASERTVQGRGRVVWRVRPSGW